MSRAVSIPAPKEEPANAVAAPSRRRPWSPARLGGGLVLAAWASMFWWLFLTGRVNLYLSTNTSWVVPVGAVLLTAAAVGRLLSARASEGEPLGRREQVVMALMVVPVILVMVLPPATLGAFSASKKTSFSPGVTLSSSFYDDITSTSRITLLSVAAAQTSNAGARALAQRAGSDVDFVGVASREANTPADEFLLTRYVITCCVADATIVQVRVVDVPPGAAQPNDWVEVKGQIYPLGRTMLVDAASVRTVPRPSRPYLTP
jgi:putative membrane protein